MKGKTARRKAPTAPRHRSPVPPPGGPMGKKGYDRPAARKAARKAVDESLKESPSRAGPLQATEPIETEEGPGEEE